MFIRNEKMILLGGCEHEIRLCLEPMIKSLGFSFGFAKDAEAVRSCLQTSEREIAALIIDLRTLEQEDFDTLRSIRSADPHMPIVVVAARPSTEDIVGAMKHGATEFLCAPITRDGAVATLTRALESCGTARVLVQRGRQDTGLFVGENRCMKEIHSAVAQIGQSRVPVLIQGETGTGKEVLARAIHSSSPRSGRPFLKLNCAALPSELVESELFGYERGAFTGAFRRKEGMFELADGGTLLLDEIGDMDVRLQAKLLQVLQDREFRRIGGKETVSVDVRIIAATHRDLEQSIRDRTFREDLYYRLNVVTLVVPPLRERKEDIVSIADFLLTKHVGKDTSVPRITVELRQAMMAYHWPGNIRELENAICKLIIFKNCTLIARELQAQTLRRQPASVRRGDVPLPLTESGRGVSALEEAKREKERAEIDVILSALNSTRWNRKQAAALLNIDYKSLLYKMKKLGIENGPVCVPDRNDGLEAIRSATGD